MTRTLAALLCFALLSGCQRRTDFLYRSDKVAPANIVQTHKVKELEGNSFADILWIIDNSGSMEDKQLAVINSTNDFMQNFTQKSQLRWRMGLISTDSSEKPYVGFTPTTTLDHTTTNPVDVFRAAVRRLGTNGSGTEMTFLPVMNTFQAFPTFNRSGSVLVTIVVTDEEEQSNMGAAAFVNYLTQTKKGAGNFLTYGLFSANDIGCSSGGFTYGGSIYEQFITLSKGKYYPLCDANAGTTLARLGNDIVRNIQRPRLTLKTRPVPETLRVLHLGQPLPGGAKEKGGFWLYDFDLNAIVFHDLDFAPAEDEQVQVEYEEAVWKQ